MTDEVFDIMEPHWNIQHDTIFDVEDIDYIHEFAGRQCYDSFDRPNPMTAENPDYIASIISKQHTSVLAHGHVVLRLEGISRSLAHELIRSRFLAFSEISQRFVDPTQLDIVFPPDADDNERARLRETHEIAMRAYEASYDSYMIRFTNMTDRDARKRSRSAARAHLPLSLETKMVVSGNIRAWRDFIEQRTSHGADEEIKMLAYKILAVLVEVAPNSVADLV